MQDCSNSIANVLDLLPYCTKPSISVQCMSPCGPYWNYYSGALSLSQVISYENRAPVHLRVSNLKMSCWDLTWQGTRIEVPALTARWHFPLLYRHLARWCYSQRRSLWQRLWSRTGSQYRWRHQQSIWPRVTIWRSRNTCPPGAPVLCHLRKQ